MRLLAGLLACLLPVLTSCGSEPRSALADSASLERSAWLGSADAWGLIGIPVGGGPLGYLRALTFEAPTWAPPELARVARAWPGDGAIWLQFDEGGLGRYEYVTGHLRTFEQAPVPTQAVASDALTLVVATERGELRTVGAGEEWRHSLGGRLERLEDAGDGRVLAMVRSDSGTVLRLLEPPSDEPLGERVVDGVLDLALTPLAERLYYLPVESPQPVVRGLALPDLSDAERLVLPRPGYALAATPSGHRLYVATGRTLQVFDRLRGRSLGEVELPETVSGLRFGANGATLLARVADRDAVVVVQVGVDSVLGTVESSWGKHLPVALPGGRLITSLGDSLVLLTVPGLLEIARYGVEQPRVWLPVEWQPPRPRALARAEERGGAGRGSRVSRTPVDSLLDTEPPPGHYAVVSAARERGGVANLVSWLQSVGYPGRMDQHIDAMGTIWYRAMVGPYAGRPAAESASRSLSSRYGYKPWILVIEARDAVDEGGAADSVSASPARDAGASDGGTEEEASGGGEGSGAGGDGDGSET